MTTVPGAFSAQDFRTVLGHFPTGVTVITSATEALEPVGLAVGSFTSVSLEPPLIAFLPAKSSTTFPKIRETGRFCVNVLAADQEDACRAFARSGGPKFDGLAYKMSPGTCPIIEGAVAWIDCTIESVIEAGDHYICLGRVTALEVESGTAPLIFFKGGYGGFATASLAAPAEDDLIAQLLMVDLARPEMERLADAVGAECIASAVVGDDLVTMAVAGTAPPGRPGTRVGLRIPFIAPVAPLFVAFGTDEDRESWLDVLPGMSAEDRARYCTALAATRDRGHAFGTHTPRRQDLVLALAELHVDAPRAAERAKVREAVKRLADTYDPDDLTGSHGVEYIGAPVFDKNGRMALQLTLFGLPPAEADAATSHVKLLLDACRRVTEALGGHPPNHQSRRRAASRDEATQQSTGS